MMAYFYVSSAACIHIYISDVDEYIQNLLAENEQFINVPGKFECQFAKTDTSKMAVAIILGKQQ